MTYSEPAGEIEIEIITTIDGKHERELPEWWDTGLEIKARPSIS
jgi:hypothetical protein